MSSLSYPHPATIFPSFETGGGSPLISSIYRANRARERDEVCVCGGGGGKRGTLKLASKCQHKPLFIAVISVEIELVPGGDVGAGSLSLYILFFTWFLTPCVG